MESEPVSDLAHLGHVELLTPKPHESLRFFVEVLGMTETARQGESVYLRGWDDYEHHTLKLTGRKPLACATWRSAREARRRSVVASPR